MTAHPKIDPVTGTMHFFGYNVFKPYLTYHQSNVSGELIKSEPIETNGPAMMHDFAMTENYVIFMELPVLFSPLAGKMMLFAVWRAAKSWYFQGYEMV